MTTNIVSHRLLIDTLAHVARGVLVGQPEMPLTDAITTAAHALAALNLAQMDNGIPMGEAEKELLSAAWAMMGDGETRRAVLALLTEWCGE